MVSVLVYSSLSTSISCCKFFEVQDLVAQSTECFFGAMIYADDIFLLSASRTGIQHMVNTCYNFTSKMNLNFGTS